MKKTILAMIFASLLVMGSGFISVSATPIVLAVDSDDFYLISDANDDALYQTYQDLHSMRIDANSTGILVTVTGAVGGGGAHLYVDTDPGAATEVQDMTEKAWWRPFKISGGFSAEYVAAAWQDNFGDLWNITGEANDVIEDADTKDIAGYSFAKDTTGADGSQVGDLKYFFTYDLLKINETSGTGTVGFMAVTLGGGSATVYDAIPNQVALPPVTENDLVILNNFVMVTVTDTTDGSLAPGVDTFGWMGEKENNLIDGNLTAGNDLIIKFSVWGHDGSVDQNAIKNNANDTNAVMFDYDIGREGGNVSESTYAFKTFNDGEGNNDFHVAKVESFEFQEGDYVNWTATAGEQVVTGNFWVSALPDLNVTYVGGVTPAGGFVTPNATLTINALANWRFADNDDPENLGIHDNPAANLPVEMTLWKQDNSTGAFMANNMTWVAAADNNDAYKLEFLVDPTLDNITFYIEAWVWYKNGTTNSLKTENFTLLVGIEPERVLQYSIDDAADDISLERPTNEPPKPVFYPGTLDVVKFEVLQNDFNTEFRLTFNNLTNAFGSPAGYSMAIFSIYIDYATGGETKTLWNERVTTSEGWEIAMKADGFVSDYYMHDDTSAPMTGTGMITYGDIVAETASIVIPRYTMDMDYSADWNFFVLVGSDDFNAFRAAGPTAGEWAIGGGEEGENDPNVFDMITPSGADAKLQDFLLSRYDTASGTLAEVIPFGENQAFTADTAAPTVSVTAKYEGAEITGDLDLGDADELNVTLSLTLADTDVNVLSGLDYMEVFDGNILIEEVALDGSLSQTLDYVVSLGEGTHELKINVYDNTGNVAQATVTVVIGGEEDAAFLPVPVAPFLFSFFAVALVIRRKR